MSEPQSYAHHHRFDPWYHIVAFGVLLVAFLMSVVHLVHHHDHQAVWQFLVSFGLLVVWGRVRIYSLKVQDRLIRLEETLRMKALLTPELMARVPELQPAQFVALRFASDAELPARVAEALDGKLGSKAIKQNIQTWRADHFRV
jgi:hypothetical protein